MQDLDRWIEELDDELHLGTDKFGFTIPEQVENHNAHFEYLRAGFNKLTKCLRAVN